MNIHRLDSPTSSPVCYRNLLRTMPMIWLLVFAPSAPASPGPDGGGPDYKVGFLGNPSAATEFEMSVPVPWTRETIGQLKKLGFNTIQLDVAWGTRPADEPLNIEDVVQLSAEQDQQYPQVVPLRCRPGGEAREKRRAELRRRIALCQEAGLRTLFHFGAPYNAHARYGDGPPNCLMDQKLARRYELLLEVFARDFPGVDDLLIYTYDQEIGRASCRERV